MKFSAFSPPASGSIPTGFSGGHIYGRSSDLAKKSELSGAFIQPAAATPVPEVAEPPKAPAEPVIYRDAQGLVVELNLNECKNVRTIFFGGQSAGTSELVMLTDNDRSKLRFKVNRNGHDIDATIGKKQILKISAIVAKNFQILRKAPYAAMILSASESIEWLERIENELEKGSQPAPAKSVLDNTVINTPPAPEPALEIEPVSKQEDIPSSDRPQGAKEKIRKDHYADQYKRIVVDLDEKALRNFMEERRERMTSFIYQKWYPNFSSSDAEDAFQIAMGRIFMLQQQERLLRSLPFRCLEITEDEKHRAPVYSSSKTILRQAWERKTTAFCKNSAFFSTWAYQILSSAAHSIISGVNDAMGYSFPLMQESDHTTSDFDNALSLLSDVDPDSRCSVFRDPFEILLECEEKYLLRAVLEHHKPANTDHRNYFQAIKLHVLDGRQYQEIAALLDIPIGTVRSRISRGKPILLEIIAKLQSGGEIPHLMPEPG